VVRHAGNADTVDKHDDELFPRRVVRHASVVGGLFYHALRSCGAHPPNSPPPYAVPRQRRICVPDRHRLNTLRC
jgi:hypothetical protein